MTDALRRKEGGGDGQLGFAAQVEDLLGGQASGCALGEAEHLLTWRTAETAPGRPLLQPSKN